MAVKNSFGAQKTLKVGSKEFEIYSLKTLSEKTGANLDQMPVPGGTTRKLSKAFCPHLKNS